MTSIHAGAQPVRSSQTSHDVAGTDPPAGASLPRTDAVEAIIRLALGEDVGRGDITTEATVAPDTMAVAEIVQKQAGVLCGLPVVEAVFAAVDPRVQVTRLAEEGSWGERRVVARIEGPARGILTGERTALNFLQRLAGVATMARRAAEAVASTKTEVLDTRKTTPGVRILEKYAVRVGGCRNHRTGLDDAFLIKENHIRAAGGITAAVHRARGRAGPTQRIEIEVTNLDELDEAIAAGAEMVLLDNFVSPPPPVTTPGATPIVDVSRLREAVERAAGRVILEASGTVTLATLPAIASTGVDYASMGALTHSAGSLDFSLDFSLGVVL
ncbi:MAG: carboxylating nicotinate-nucleotide diphosphorylase [Chloroflexi bacterium]|nr:carboxylating nicotinate-nucleotide diphosphorylase [Chloroflexota bacterium]